MKSAATALILSLCLGLLPGCTILAMLETPADFERKYLAVIIKDTIDRAIAAELAKKEPDGYPGAGYSRELWQKYWNSRIHGLLTDRTSEHYRGPSGYGFYQYIISSRRSVGLPPIVLDAANRKELHRLREVRISLEQP